VRVRSLDPLNEPTLRHVDRLAVCSPPLLQARPQRRDDEGHDCGRGEDGPGDCPDHVDVHSYQLQLLLYQGENLDPCEAGRGRGSRLVDVTGGVWFTRPPNESASPRIRGTWRGSCRLCRERCAGPGGEGGTCGREEQGAEPAVVGGAPAVADRGRLQQGEHAADGAGERGPRGRPTATEPVPGRPWVPRTVSRHATCTYSCMRPPSRSRRSGRMVGPPGWLRSPASPRCPSRPADPASRPDQQQELPAEQLAGQSRLPDA
jgi:hypothetical protein